MSLVISNLSIRNGAKDVVSGVSLTLEAGSVTAVIGANGAGKSELILGIAGTLPLAEGMVECGGVDLTGQGPEVIRKAGIAAVPEGHVVFGRLSVDDNLRAAGALISLDDLEGELDRVYRIFPELAERKSQLAGTMSGGQQQMLAIGHALMARPKFLLIDEMSLGLAPLIVHRLMDVVKSLKSNGVGILLVEQFTELALGVAENALVLRNGHVRFNGPAATLREDASVLDEAYFGAERTL